MMWFFSRAKKEAEDREAERNEWQQERKRIADAHRLCQSKAEEAYPIGLKFEYMTVLLEVVEHQYNWEEHLPYYSVNLVCHYLNDSKEIIEIAFAAEVVNSWEKDDD